MSSLNILTSFVARDTYLRSTMVLNEQTFYITRSVPVFLKMTGALSFQHWHELTSIQYRTSTVYPVEQALRYLLLHGFSQPLFLCNRLYHSHVFILECTVRRRL